MARTPRKMYYVKVVSGRVEDGVADKVACSSCLPDAVAGEKLISADMVTVEEGQRCDGCGWTNDPEPEPKDKIFIIEYRPIIPVSATTEEGAIDELKQMLKLDDDEDDCHFRVLYVVEGVED